LKKLDRLIEIIKDVASGRYTNEIMDLAAPNVEEPVRTIAEAMGFMMVKVEAREFHLELLIKQLEEVNQKIRRNTIATVSAMANALAARDAYTEGHAERVGQIAGWVAEEMSLKESEAELGAALSYIRYHHERPDGRGYPDRWGQRSSPWLTRLTQSPLIGLIRKLKRSKRASQF
jgi:response regulator RpfG family c-di-GMP phosphodiesterase